MRRVGLQPLGHDVQPLLAPRPQNLRDPAWPPPPDGGLRFTCATTWPAGVVGVEDVVGVDVVGVDVPVGVEAAGVVGVLLPPPPKTRISTIASTIRAAAASTSIPP